MRHRLRAARSTGLATDSAWGLAYEGATVFSTLVSFWLLGRTLGAEGYGSYASLYAIISPMITLAGSGMTLALMEHVVREGETLEPTVQSCFSLVLILGSLLVAGGGAITLAVVDQLSVAAVLTLLTIEFIVTPTVHIVAASLQITTGFIEASKLRLVFVATRTAVLVALAIAGRLTVTNLGIATLATSGALAIGAIVSVGRRLHCKIRPGRIAFAHLRSNVLYSAAISASALGNDGDKVVLAVDKRVVETGLYSAAYRVVQFGMLPVASVVNAGHVRFLHHEPGVRRQHLDRALRYARFSLLYGVVCAAGLIVAAPLLPVAFGSDFEGSITMVRWLAPVLVVRSLGAFSLNGLMGLGRNGARTVLILINTVISMGLYIALIPQFGWKGAIAATLIGETLDVAASWTALAVFQRRADRELDEEIARAGDSEGGAAPG